jgi:hypothetical protein
MTNKELIKTYRAMCKKLKIKSFYPFWFPKSYLKMNENNTYSYRVVTYHYALLLNVKLPPLTIKEQPFASAF